MNATDRPTGPYAPIKNVLDVVHRLRDRGVPVPLTADSLTTIGVPDGNAPRTFQALRFLDLVDGKGQLSEPAERLRRASTDEYPALFAEIIRAAYVPVFQLVDPAQDDEIKVADAFRQYDPAGQRDKMVTLFMGLCEEAGIVPLSDKRAQRPPQARRERPRPAKRDAPAPPPAGQWSASSMLLFGVSEDDIGALSEAEFTTVWDALGVVARARARAKRPPADDSQAEGTTGEGEEAE